MRRLFSLQAMMGVFAVTAAAQSPRASVPATLITHATCVDSTRRLLGSLLGDYRVMTVFRAGPAAWDSTPARARFEWELGGCLMIEHLDGHRGNESYETVALWGTSGSSDNPVQRVFAHSQHGLLGLSEGRWNRSGDTLTLADSALVRGAWIQERYVVSRPRQGTFTAEGRRSEDGGKTWLVTLRARYSRV